MTLRRSLTVRYAAVTGICLLLLGVLAYHELITEPNDRKRLGIPEAPESFWSEYLELFVYAMIPLILGGGWYWMRQTMLPLDALAKDVERVSAANLNEPLALTGNQDEVDRLAGAFNNMATRLHESFQQMRHFTLHASHELKTPLTVMWLQLGALLQDGQSLSPEQRESLECQLNEVQRLSRIVSSLTLLTKADTGLVTLRKEPVHLADLVREAFEDAQILAETEDVQVAIGGCDDLVLVGDRDRLRQLLLNLIDNAIKYNRRGGNVSLTLLREEAMARLEVTNTGEGIPAELQARLFQRFVRGDQARSRAIEGSGLGLSICQWIVQAHGGTIGIGSDRSGLTRVVVRCPLQASETG